MFGSLNVCVPLKEYSTFCRDRMGNTGQMILFKGVIFTRIHGIGLWQFALQAIRRQSIILISFSFVIA